MATVLLTFPIPQSCRDRLADAFDVKEAIWAEGEGLINAARGCEGALTGTEQWPRAIFDAVAPPLRAIARFGTGTDAVDLAAATEHGVAVCNTPGANAQALAEFAVGLMWALSRQITLADKSIRTSGFEMRTKLGGVDLNEKTVGIVGFGEAGSRVGRICQHGFGMRVLVNTARPDPKRLSAAGIDGRMVALPELLRESDFVTLHLPVTETSRGLIGRRELELMRPGAYLVNVSRGALIDSQAVADALKAKSLNGYGTDVYEVEPPPTDHPLFGAPNTILAPHYSGHTTEGLRHMGDQAVENLVEALNGRRPKYAVNPDVFGASK